MEANYSEWIYPILEESKTIMSDVTKLPREMYEEYYLKIKLLSLDAILPTKAHATDAGYDLYAINDSRILARNCCKFDTDIAIELPPGYWGLIKERSSMAAAGISVLGGVIDNGYRGPIKVCLANHSDSFYMVKKGDRIAQLILIPSPTFTYPVEQCDELSDTARAAGGFGSSGK